MEHNCLAYNKMILLVALVSICVLVLKVLSNLSDVHWKYRPFVHEEKVEDTNEVARSHRSKDSQHNGQMKKDKQRSTKHYTEN